ncbi:MAG: hypothetical protein ABI707_01640 [Ferruginibacter sp.]
MGNFLALSGVVGKTQQEVLTSLTNYARSVNGGVQQEQNINSDNDNCCIISEANGNTSVFYPDGYLEWDDSSEFISKELNATVFSFHIHDSDLWMYLLYNNGQIVDQFNPVPDYWDDNLSEKEIESWKGSSSTLAKYINYIKPGDIEKYLVRWDLDEEESSKAYPTDEFNKEEWQLVDFMNKIKLPYPLDDNGNHKGETYRLWTDKLKLKPQQVNNRINIQSGKTEKSEEKPWWKFW